jgi:hypothetical protein
MDLGLRPAEGTARPRGEMASMSKAPKLGRPITRAAFHGFAGF